MTVLLLYLGDIWFEISPHQSWHDSSKVLILYPQLISSPKPSKGASIPGQFGIGSHKLKT